MEILQDNQLNVTNMKNLQKHGTCFSDEEYVRDHNNFNSQFRSNAHN